jgi:hypothetical protein
MAAQLPELMWRVAIADEPLAEAVPGPGAPVSMASGTIVISG